jgi:hypothetical protein
VVRAKEVSLIADSVQCTEPLLHPVVSERLFLRDTRLLSSVADDDDDNVVVANAFVKKAAAEERTQWTNEHGEALADAKIPPKTYRTLSGDIAGDAMTMASVAAAAAAGVASSNNKPGARRLSQVGSIVLDRSVLPDPRRQLFFWSQTGGSPIDWSKSVVQAEAQAAIDLGLDPFKQSSVINTRQRELKFPAFVFDPEVEYEFTCKVQTVGAALLCAIDLGVPLHVLFSNMHHAYAHYISHFLLSHAHSSTKRPSLAISALFSPRVLLSRALSSAARCRSLKSATAPTTFSVR